MDGGDDGGGGGGGQGGVKSSLAMIILYAITGCVSALFCVVIVSGVSAFSSLHYISYPCRCFTLLHAADLRPTFSAPAMSRMNRQSELSGIPNGMVRGQVSAFGTGTTVPRRVVLVASHVRFWTRSRWSSLGECKRVI